LSARCVARCPARFGPADFSFAVFRLIIALTAYVPWRVQQNRELESSQAKNVEAAPGRGAASSDRDSEA